MKNRVWPVMVAAAIAASILATAVASAQPANTHVAKPTIVLVHGAWADGSSWNGVIRRLQDEGYKVLAPANPLRGLQSDSAYISSILSTLSEPVVLVGHSYGGAVITNAANGHANVKALVFVAAFIPDKDETLGELSAKFPGSQLAPPGIPGVTATLVIRPTPTGLDAYIDPEKFRQIFAADVPAEKAEVLAVTQRGTDVGILQEKSGTPAWKSLPSWAVIGTQDNAIGTANTRYMANRAAPTRTVEVSASHVVMISHPGVVFDLIVKAARGLP